MHTFRSIADILESYSRMGGVREDTPCGMRYRFSPTPSTSTPLDGLIEFFGDPSTFFLSVSDLSFSSNLVVRVQLDQRYIGLSFSDIGLIETYRRRSETRTLGEGVYFYVASSPGPFFARAETGVRFRFTAMYFMEAFFDENDISLSDELWSRCERVLNTGDHNIPTLGVICQQILNTNLSGRSFDTFIRGQGLTAAALILDHVEQFDRNTPPPSSETSLLVEQAQAILKADLRDPPTIQALAKQLGTNKNRLQASFSSLEGKTVSRYLLTIRMQQALDLLAETELPIKEIAERVGYRGKSNFYRAFREIYRYGPSEMRSYIRAAE